VVATNDDRGNLGREAPTNRGDEKAALLRETTEALTALGNYLEVAQHEFQNQPGLMREALGDALRESLGQYERAAGCIRRLRELLLREGPSNDDRQGID
jgi:hypothetical protein